MCRRNIWHAVMKIKSNKTVAVGGRRAIRTSVGVVCPDDPSSNCTKKKTAKLTQYIRNLLKFCVTLNICSNESSCGLIPLKFLYHQM